jgi:UDP-glucose 4-epimerase
VLQVLKAVRAVTGLPVPHEPADRRLGDPARIVGTVDRIARELGWTAQRDLQDMVRSAWAAEQAPPVH